MNNKNQIIQNLGLFIGSLLLVTFIAVLMAWPLQWLWNTCLVPAVTFANPIGFWQALGINVLSSILFSNGVSSKNSKSE